MTRLWHKIQGSKIALSMLVGSCLLSCSGLPIEFMASHNYNERIRFLVMHYTTGNYQDSMAALVDKGGLSAHYLVPEHNDPSYPYTRLKIIQLVDESQRAWHAGASYWQGRRNLNDHSIGIEIVNTAQCEQQASKNDENISVRQQNIVDQLCLFPDYDQQQMALLIALSQDILSRNPDISPTEVVGHSDIAPSRKSDPGPRFPWYQLYKAGIGAWYDNDTVEYYWHRFEQQQPDLGLIQQALNLYGYQLSESGLNDNETINTISAFQMHFLPWHVSGVADNKTAAVLFALIEKYFPNKLNVLNQRYETQCSDTNPEG